MNGLRNKTRATGGLASFIFPMVVLALLVPSAFPQGMAPARIERIGKFYEKRDGFMGTVAVAQNGRLLSQTSYGYANVASQVRFTPDTRFRVGSITKQFTSAAVLLLQQDGKLKTSDPIGQHYKDAPVAWAKVTLRDLLRQSSGIPDTDFGLDVQDATHSPQRVLQEVLTKPLKFAPGTQFDYSNNNYVLLTLAIEQASGEPYCQFVTERILKPLHLIRTGCDWTAPLVEPRALGHQQTDRGLAEVKEANLTGIAGAGELYSTAGDLLRWAYALHHGGLLSAASYTEMTRPFLGGYGYGFWVSAVNGKKDLYHNGKVPGYFAQLDYFLENGTAIVILSNLENAGQVVAPGVAAIDNELMQLASDSQAILPSESREKPVTAEVLRRYLGAYRTVDRKSDHSFLVVWNGNHLQVKGEEADPGLALRAESKSRFYVDGKDLEIDFDLKNSPNAVVLNFTDSSATAFDRSH